MHKITFEPNGFSYKVLVDGVDYNIDLMPQHDDASEAFEYDEPYEVSEHYEPGEGGNDMWTFECKLKDGRYVSIPFVSGGKDWLDRGLNKFFKTLKTKYNL